MLRNCYLQCKRTPELTTHHFTSNFSIILSVYPSFALSLSPPGLSVPLCHLVAGFGEPWGIDWTWLNAVRLTGDMWFTDEILALLHSACNHTTSTRARIYSMWTQSAYTQMNTHYIMRWCTKTNACTHTLKWVPHTRTYAHTPTQRHTHTPLGVPPDTLNLSQLKPRGLCLRVRRAETVDWAQQSLS